MNYIERTKQLASRLEQNNIKINGIQSEYILSDKAKKAIVEILEVGNIYVQVLYDVVRTVRSDDDLTVEDKEKIKLINEHYKSTKNILESYEFD
jgi:hypothetical protein